MNRRLRARLLPIVVVVVTTLATTSWAIQEPPPGDGPRQFGAEYAGLSDRQKALIDDIFRRFEGITGRQVDPEQTYDGLRLSVRTTFDAITHALTQSTLTEAETGEPLGLAIDLIDHVETVAGKVRGASGDRQFRLYVALKPDARELLERSEEFDRKGNNTIFHKGYPLNYRQEGVPSMQFSISRDGKRADIDVDYRSEKFPNSLVNGHLTSANSDVRAGNHSRHNERWEGLVNWWEGFFGRLLSTDTYGDESDESREFPLHPPKGNKTVDVAVQDFLTSWLVEGQPNRSVSYFHRDAFECAALRLEQRGEELDRGLAPIQMYVRMQKIADELGRRGSLADYTVGVRLPNPNLKLVRQRHHAQFVLYGVPRAFAESMRCGNYTRLGELPKDRQLRLVGERPESFFSAFSLVAEGDLGAMLGLLWEKREGFWKIVAFEVDVESETEQNSMPDLGEEMATDEVPRVEGDPAVVAASQGFLDAWIVEKDYDRAMAHFSPRAYPCVNLTLDPGEEPKQAKEEQRQRLRFGVERLGEVLGEVESLEAAIEGVEIWDPRVHIVAHPHENAFGVFSWPDWAGQQADCVARLARGDTPAEEGANQGHGNYYATALKVDTYTGEPAVLLLGWDKADGDWRIFTYKVVDP